MGNRGVLYELLSVFLFSVPITVLKNSIERNVQMQFIIIFLIFVMVVLFSLQSLFSRMQATAYPGDSTLSSIVFTFWFGIFIALFTCFLKQFSFSLSLETIWLGILNAAIVMGYYICLIGASDRGAYSTTTIFMIFGGILIPLLVSVLFMEEKIRGVQWAAIFAMLISFYILNKEPQQSETKQTQKRGFFIFCVFLFLFNGIYGVIMDVQQKITGNQENAEMVIVTYIALAIFSFVFLFLRSRCTVRGTVQVLRQSRRSFLFVVLAAMAGTAAQNLLLYLLGHVPAGILYTFDNGGVMLISMLFSMLFFKERPNKLCIFAIFLAFLALIILCVC